MTRTSPAIPLPARERCADCPIRYRAVCASCESEELSHLERIKSYKSYAAGCQIQWAGETLTHFGSVVEGCAVLSRTLEDGRRQTLGLLLPSDFVGRPGRDSSAYDIVAATDVKLCRFERAAFESLIRKSPTIESRLLQMTLDELDAARDWMLLLGRKTARERLASLFVILARRGTVAEGMAPDGQMDFTLPITREAIADYLGLTIETVSRQITALKKEGIIAMPSQRRVVIPDFNILMEVAGDDSDGGLPA